MPQALDALISLKPDEVVAAEGLQAAENATPMLAALVSRTEGHAALMRALQKKEALSAAAGQKGAANSQQPRQERREALAAAHEARWHQFSAAGLHEGIHRQHRQRREHLWQCCRGQKDLRSRRLHRLPHPRTRATARSALT
jgi:hypothetical protein